MKKILLVLLMLANLHANIKDNQEACDSGDGNACFELGILYNYGRGVTKDYKKAIELYTQACDIGNTKGCYNLGIMYKSGQGVKRDYTKAVKFYKKSCDGGDPWGCRNLGAQYVTGTGVKQDYKKASELYTKACDAGYMDACANIGAMYDKGLGVKQDYKKASELYTKACDAGNTAVCANLALFYLEGLGVRQDKAKAMELVKKSCDGGDQQACDAYNEFVPAMQEEIAKVSKIKNKPKFYEENFEGLVFCSASYYVRTLTPKKVEYQSKIYTSYGQLTSFIGSLYFKKIFNKVATNGVTSEFRDILLKDLAKEYRKNKTLLPKTLIKIAQCDSLIFYLNNNPQVIAELKNNKKGTLDNEALLFDELAITTKKPIEVNKDYILESFRMWIEDHDGLTAGQMKEKILQLPKETKK